MTGNDNARYRNRERALMAHCRTRIETWTGNGLWTLARDHMPDTPGRQRHDA
jgi:hypothetical protein